ncbi:hypothetical protein [Nannocystis bainbridge]|uniref:Glycosyltransferase RgtA/B/C/D-like domain-containing protein n=1 Tax=Nannocystis bainbridge TaxID=2995303 RepID=A0ABT5E9D2_9BACT|nr:hypothetical protein [Nannocystis bainbridge]MDC0722468.1 hypothetical protein [Nannocystis bainbridge]
MPGLSTALALLTVFAVAALLRDRLGAAAALGVALAGTFLIVSAVGLILLDLGRLQPWPLRLALLAAFSAFVLLAGVARRRLPRATPTPVLHARPLALGLGVLLVTGVGLRLAPSPYLQGGQDQGIYVNVGHHIARTGRLRPVDRLLRGAVRGVPQADVLAAYRVKPLAADSPLVGVREGRWAAGLHIEDARAGRLVPAFFPLMPVWFAIAELDGGFARSTWPLVLFWALSALALFALARRLAQDSDDPLVRRRAGTLGLVALAGLALHPLDLWISSFTVTENLARACLLAAAWLALEAGAAERDGRPGARLLALLGGLCFAAGAFTRGSLVAHAIVLAGALLLGRGDAPRTRRALLGALVVGTTLAVVQAVLHSWPYFFSAAANHFHVPRLTPRPAVAVAWTLAAGLALLLVELGLRRLPARLCGLARRSLRLAAGLALALAAVGFVRQGLVTTGADQQVLAVLVRHGGPLPLLLGLVGLGLAVRRADARLLPWLVLAAAIVLEAALKSGVRYEFYYARYFIADLVPALTIAAACLSGHIITRLERRRGPRLAALACGALLLAWLVPPLRLLPREVYWTRDLADDPEQLTSLFGHVPEDALLLFDDRAPGRWRGLLAVPALLSFGRNALAVPPGGHIVEGALKAGTPVLLLSGGWEPDDRQRWPSADSGPWRTRVIARGIYQAPRAETVEGGVPARLHDGGGPWELQQLDRSIWRSSGAFSLYPDSMFVTATATGFNIEPLPLPAGARVELWLPTGLSCDVTAKLDTDPLPLTPLPRQPDGPLLWSLPPTPPQTAALTIAATCDGAFAWRWLSVRAEP